MIEIEWQAVRLPGVFKPSAPPYSFELKPAAHGIARASFDGNLAITKGSLLCFSLHSPTSGAMFPDIVRGDFGFPTVCVKNSRGTVLRFARGNMKDFFDIQIPNTPQVVRLPLNAFQYDKDLKSNVPGEEDFFEHPAVGMYMDFLCHPSENIDIVVGAIGVQTTSERTALDVRDCVYFERIGQAPHYPPFSTQVANFMVGVSLNQIALSMGLSGATLELALLKNGSQLGYSTCVLQADNRYLNLSFPQPGHFTIRATLRRDGETFAMSEWPACRMLPRISKRATKIGISDNADYDRIAALGGGWDRLPISFRETAIENGEIRSLIGRDSLPATRPSSGNRRLIAGFATPKWLSRMPDRSDFYRYAPSNLRQYAKLVGWMAREMQDAGGTHFEVWNEASALGHWIEDMPTLTELHRVTYDAVKSVNPDIVVLGGCTHSWTFDFIERFLDAGGAAFCDGLSIHGYTYQPFKYLEHYDQMDGLVRSVRESKPTFNWLITEIGFRYPAFSLESQAKFFSLFSLEAASRELVEAIIWFRYMNPRPEIMSGYRQNSSAGYGMVGHNGSYCRPALAAYRFVERLLQQFDEVRASGPATSRRYEFFRNGAAQAVGLFQPEGELDLPNGWRRLDHYGAPLEERADLTFAVSPSAVSLLQ